MGVWAFFQSLLHTLLPPELRFAGATVLRRLYDWSSPYCYYDITEIDGVSTNELYNSAQLYLSSSASITGSRLSLTRATNSATFTFSLSHNDRLTDTFDSVPVVWEHRVLPRQPQTFSWRPLPEEKRAFTLKIKKSHKSLILKSYLEHIMERANEIKRKNQDRYLYTNSRGGSMDARGNPWESVPFKHPSTFETLAMDPDQKQEILADLEEFANGQSFYQKTGRAWKRGYLLFGPPGTGKSSMIAAMANFLGYDIYDLELTEVNSNSELRKLLMKTSSKSIIVIEDIDCSINLSNRKKTSSSPKPDGVGGEEEGNSITLSGLLNFTDGLWSCCGSERIFVFTTNHVEKLDPALLRSGRMDMHIHMSYCSYEAAKILLKNYLGFDEEDLGNSVRGELEDVINEAKMTPADVSEVLIKNRRNKENAVRELVRILKERRGRERVEEEQEKRALDSPKLGVEVEDQEEEMSCGKSN